ncbi:hypothetical protein PTTG_05664 [Puccinia triticina 1-1 BBBD Race 1]|uniref:RRM domain-containing protein n=2 Tax=Puccinia triticina TaxID=208348 RepID=A0A0C4EXW5_PUCT1|nr:uncharacterized protein PtA15_4A418 [Puccinia triticina]OAV89884.1 hypothetical protein PTTG_05664 [Puccinia triticina 1-1 BBBD Race 1]WAQ83967.1 hypothetical protein PtA15_4A418 [Puccinia triticina]WAR54813.1 hypothetical protein PtB15_4B431 [Puccinia triticina]
MSTTAAAESTPSVVPALPQSQLTTASNSVYVGDLPADITEEQLIKVFSQASPVLKVEISSSKRSTEAPRTYAHIRYSSAKDATQAIEEFNQVEFSGKPCRVMKSTRGASKGLPEANVFVKNLPLDLSAVAFHDTFAAYGEILSSKLAVDKNNTSKGYGFVQYASAEQAKKAIAETNGSTLDVEGADKPIQTSLFVKREARRAPREFNNLFFKNLSTNVTLEGFKKTWSKYGVITSAILNKGEDGKPSGTAFANFEKSSAAAKVVKATQSKAPDGVYAVPALSKAERERHQSRKAAKAAQESA